MKITSDDFAHLKDWPREKLEAAVAETTCRLIEGLEIVKALNEQVAWLGDTNLALAACLRDLHPELGQAIDELEKKITGITGIKAAEHHTKPRSLWSRIFGRSA